MPIFAGFIWYIAAGFEPKWLLAVLLFANAATIITNLELTDRDRFRTMTVDARGVPSSSRAFGARRESPPNRSSPPPPIS